ncbi:hypothetical protein [Clavibacter tessellarius]|uniref:hypothetical protein n=1 Tax=Clavibacter TaxID=1573 RepID=UPI0039E732EB
MVWDESSEITVRLSLRGDELWAMAGSGVLVRFVETSEGEFDLDQVEHAVGLMLRGLAVEFFGAADDPGGEAYPSGFEIGSARAFAGGLDEGQSRFRARLAGPMFRATVPIAE